MRTRVQKWGNSLAVRIPKPFAEGAGLAAAAEVELSLEDGRLQITAARPRWNLRDLVGRISRRNLHAGVDTGPRVGREAW